MIALALDTTTAAGSLAVCEGDRVLAEERGDAARPHGERLPADVLRVLGRGGRALDAIDLFVVASGPGAFTGLRIGIAAIQGFAFALGRPAVGVSALEAHAHLLRTSGACPDDALFGVWMDAARGEVFHALYAAPSPDRSLVRVGSERVGTPADVLNESRADRAGRIVCWTGSGATRYEAVLAAADRRTAVVGDLPPLARAVARLGLEAHAAGRSGLPHAIQPLYVRRPDAELARDRNRPSGRPA